MHRCFFYITIVVVLNSACTKLKEDFKGDLSAPAVEGNADALLKGVYTNMQEVFTSHLVIFPLEELSTDEMIAPVRGTDWADNNMWREFHLQNWTAYNPKIRECFNALNGIAFTATDVLYYHPNPEQKAEARFIRAWAMYLLLDMFNQVPIRAPGESVVQPSQILVGLHALDTIIYEISESIPKLDVGPVYKANKFAALFLLMKCYLNKAVYANREHPSFSKEDMTKVIEYADKIIEEGSFGFADNYFNNFCPDNGNLGTENIFTIKNDRGELTNNLINVWLMTLHYDQFFPNGGGLDGFTTLSNFYEKFELSDKRRGMIYNYNLQLFPNSGQHVNVGFLAGQQYYLFDSTKPLDTIFTNDASHLPLYYTNEVRNLETGPNLRITGIRGLKYYPDFNRYDAPDNDFVFFRYPDVLLMKAEAFLRLHDDNTDPAATDIVNSIRTHSSRNASQINNVTLDSLFDERGRELWWEGWRRQDMIRFGKFLNSFQQKEYQSDPKYLIYPIPAEQLSVNPNLVQNDGY